MQRLLALAAVCLAFQGLAPAAAAKDRSLRTENVFLVISDGLRWQEVFRGAEEALLNKTNGGVKNVEVLRTNFWRTTPELRRAALLPFCWDEIARGGQLYGNQSKGSVAKVANTRKFSYPGYNELLTGWADPGIDSNDKQPNPNVTVFEWLQQKPRLQKRVVAFATWDVFPYIFNRERSGIPIWPAWEPRFEDRSITPPPMLSRVMRDTTPIFEGVVLDAFAHHTALDHVQRKKPRLVFLGFGETDEWAHAGRYDLYLEAAHAVDRSVQELWTAVQAIPQYRGKTTFIISADHGRGSGPSAWKDHGEKVDGAEGIWLAVLGPDTPPLGEQFQTGPVSQSQIAATIAALLGEDYQAAFPKAGAPIGDILGYLSPLSAPRR